MLAAGPHSFTENAALRLHITGHLPLSRTAGAKESEFIRGKEWSVGVGKEVKAWMG